jgi:nicotinate phosphoribosyltransferase
MRGGNMIPGNLPPLSEIRELAQQNLAQLPTQYRELCVAQPYPVRFSGGLQSLRKQAALSIGKSL